MSRSVFSQETFEFAEQSSYKSST